MSKIHFLVAEPNKPWVGSISPMRAESTDALHTGMIGQVQIVGMETVIDEDLIRFRDLSSSCDPGLLVTNETITGATLNMITRHFAGAIPTVARRFAARCPTK